MLETLGSIPSIAKRKKKKKKENKNKNRKTNNYL
jgi:hypothetical protein